MDKLLSILTATTILTGCSDEFYCKDLDPRSYGDFTAEMQVCDWGNEDFEQDSKDVFFLKLKNSENETVCEGELNPTELPFVFDIKTFNCDVDKDGEMDFPQLKNASLIYNGNSLCVDEHDQQGRKILSLCDWDTDALIDTIDTFEYSKNGKTQLIDSNADGIIDTKKEYVNDELVKESKEGNEQGIFKIIKDYVGGKLVKESRDNDFDGQPDWFEEFNDKGLTKLLSYTNEEGKTLTSYFWYDDQGRKILQRTDDESDGIIDFEVTTVYDQIKIEISINFEDGVIQSVVRTEYHPDLQKNFIDKNANGVYERMYEYFPQNGISKQGYTTQKLLKIGFYQDQDENNEFDYIEKFNLEGKMIQNSDLTGDYWRHVYWTLDEQGNPYLTEIDNNGDGNIDITDENTFYNGKEIASKFTTFEQDGSVILIGYKSIFHPKFDQKCPDSLYYRDANVDLLGNGNIDYVEHIICDRYGYPIENNKIPL
tara:strand:+ start:28043 stop:29488 length:1446 start_codon:yes stop_codon:yes gene_type:complete